MKETRKPIYDKESENQEEFELVHYEKDGVSLDVKVSRADGTAWLSAYDLAALYGKDRTVMLRHVKNILESPQNRTVGSPETVGAKSNRTCAKFAQVQEEGGRLVRREIDLFSIDVALRIGDRVDSRNGYLLKEFVDEYMRKSRGGHNDIIIYNNGNVSLAVNVSPEEETVWLSAAQIALLFDVSVDNVYLHIRNIVDDGELPMSISEDSSVMPSYKRTFTVPGSNGRDYQADYYNLDVILTVGYRVRSKRAMEFRAWANSILRNYLLKGYALDDKRALITNDNYINLIHRVDSIGNHIEDIDARVSTLERLRVVESGRIFYNGSFFDAREFIKGLVSGAKESIVLIDPYSDARTLDFLKQRPDGVKIKLYTSSKAGLTEIDVASFNRQYGGLTVFKDDTFHDRFMVIDGSILYHIGASLNYAGKKTFAVSMLEAEKMLPGIMESIKEDPILMD